MIYNEKLILSKKEAEFINKAINYNPKNEEECFREDTTVINTVVFPDGVEMDVKCCGVQYDENSQFNTAWGEAVLFKNGCQVAYTEPADEYFCTWNLEYNGNTYIVDVIEEAEEELAA